MKAEVSALMDDALEEHSRSSVLDNLCRDSRLRQTWFEYHLVGDALRSSRFAASSATFRVLKALDEEPTVIAPAVSPRRRPQLLRYALPLAASVMGVGVVGWVAQSMTGTPEEVPRTALRSDPVLPLANITSLPVAGMGQASISTLAKPKMDKPPKLKPYLFAHQGFSPVTSIQGAAHYVRIVSEARQGDSR